MELEIRGVGDIDLIVEEEKSFGVNGPTWGWGVELGGCNQIGAELLDVHDDCGVWGRDGEKFCTEGQCQLLLCGYGAEIVQVYAGIVTSSLFRVDIPLSH